MFTELRRAGRGAGQGSAAAGPEEETSDPDAAGAGVHHLVSAEGGEHGESACSL